MERMLFSEEGVKRLKKFGSLIGWKDREWKSGRWSKKEERQGMRWKPIEERLGGWLGGMGEEGRRKMVEKNRERMKVWREKKKMKELLEEGEEVKRVIGAAPIASAATIVDLKPLKDGRKAVVGGRRGRKVLVREALKELSNVGSE